jgi:hypothetical protein
LIRQVYRTQESKAEDSRNFRWLAEVLCKKLGDREWARNVYKKAECTAKSNEECRELTESIHEILGDEEWAGK